MFRLYCIHLIPRVYRNKKPSELAKSVQVTAGNARNSIPNRAQTEVVQRAAQAAAI